MSPIHQVTSNNFPETLENTNNEKPIDEKELEIQKHLNQEIKGLDQSEVYDMLPEHCDLANEYNTSPLHKMPKVIEQMTYDQEEEPDMDVKIEKNERLELSQNYLENPNDKTDTHTLIYDTSMISKNASDLDNNKSGMRAERYDSDEENPYIEGKSELMNPLMLTRDK